MSHKHLLRGAALAIAAAGLMLAQGPPSPGPGAGPGPGQGARAENRLDRIATSLNLTEGQKAQVKSIFDASLAQARPIMQQMRDNGQAISQLVKNSSGGNFDQQLQNLANTQGSLVSQLTVIHGKTMAQVYGLLNPEQRQKADQLRELLGPGMMMGGRMGGPMRPHRGPAR